MRNSSFLFLTRLTRELQPGFVYRDLKNLLIQKYDFTDEDAEGFSNYLLPMLEFSPAERTTARASAEHAWVAADSL